MTAPSLRLCGVVLLAALTGCIDWEEELEQYCLDGGSGCPADGGTDGGSDAGVDAGDTFVWDGGRVFRAIPPQAQRIPVTLAFGAPLEVELIYEDGGKAEGVSVTFTSPPDYDEVYGLTVPSANFPGDSKVASTLTSQNGRARTPELTATTKAGSFEVVAHAEGFTDAGVVFILTNLSGPPAYLNVYGTSGGYPAATTRANDRFPNPVYAQVLDVHYNPLDQYEVRFSSVEPAVPIFFADAGMQSVVAAPDASVSEYYYEPVTYSAFAGPIHAGAMVGLAQLRVEVMDGGPAAQTFGLQVTSGPPYALQWFTPNKVQSAPLGGLFQPFSFRVTDDAGYPVANTGYWISSPYPWDETQGYLVPSCEFEGEGYSHNGSTDSDGRGFAECRAAYDGGGQYPVQFGIGPLQDNGFAFTNAPPPSSASAVSGGNQSTLRNTTFALPLKIQVVDNFSDPVVNARVRFEAPATGATLRFAASGSVVEVVRTDAAGVATSSLMQASNTAGSYAVTATLEDFSGVAAISFGMTNE